MSGATVGLVGLGAMGRGVAAKLLEHGWRVVGYDVRPEAGEWLAGQGGTAAASLAEVAAADTVVSFVVDSAQTESVLFGEGGLVGRLARGATFIACSTMAPSYVRDLGVRLAREGLVLIDAPVTGGAVGAERGTLTVMGAGDPDAFARVRPVLQAFGSRIYHLGNEPGAGAQMKVINQLLCGVHLTAAGEALALARRQGLPLDLTLEILSSGAAASWMLADRGPRMIAGRHDEVTSAVDIFVKDLSLVLDATRESRFAAGLAHEAYLAFLDASARGWGQMDDSAVTQCYQPPRQP
jgi:L-threonate 2-dehydrogenase